MRHFRMPGAHNIKNFSSFEKQVGQILKQIDKFNENDKNAALSYIKKCLSRGVTKKKPVKRKKVKSNKKKNTKKEPIKLQRHVIKKLNKVLTDESLPYVKPRCFKCKECSHIEKRKTKFLFHIDSHVSTPISCLKCKKSFSNRYSFEFHSNYTCVKRRRKLENKYTCMECSMQFSFKRHYYQHIEGHKRNNCPYCEVVLTRRNDLISHMLKVHAIKLEKAIFKCDHCEKKYVKKRSLYYHMRQHFHDKIVCMECGHVLDTYENYKEHIDNHEKQKPFKCSKCGDRFSRKQQYLSHLLRHDTYKCLTCNESYSSKLRALRHKQKGHEVEGLHPRMQCPYCEKAFYRTFSLQVHLRKHSDIKPTITCKYCDKTFKSPYQYFKHCTTVNHNKKSPGTSTLVCENCGSQFTKKYLLEQHIDRVHGNKKMLTCEFCSYTTHSKSNMERHRDLHLGTNRDYICEQCGKEFPSIGSLKDHISYIHVQERIYKCEQCPKAFKRKSELVRHFQTHSNVCPFVCQICNAAFKRNSQLKRHEKSVHKINSQPTSNLRVQRLKPDSNGIFVPVIPEAKQSPMKGMSPFVPEINQTQKENFMQSVNVQQIDYFNIPFSDADLQNSKSINSNMLGFDQMDYQHQMYWNDKMPMQKPCQIYNGDNGMLPQISLSPQGSELQALNIVDQLVNSFLPDKNLQLPQEAFYDDYTDQVLQYTNLNLPGVVTTEEILTTTERILQGSCERDLMDERTDYLQNYQYME